MGLTYDALFPGRFIKAGEMGDKPATLTITSVYLDHLEGEDGREKPQAVVGFSETKREWALNKTNAQCLVAMWGPQSDDWLGKHVTLIAERDPSGLSDSGVCLRVKGSPDITKAIKAQIKLPRRRPQERVLVPTGNGNKAQNVDADSGEVFGFDGEATGDAGIGHSGVDTSNATTEPYGPPDAETGEADDIDAALGNVEPIRPPKASKSQLGTIERLIESTGIYEAELAGILDSYGAVTLDDLDKKQADYVLAALREREAGA